MAMVFTIFVLEQNLWDILMACGVNGVQEPISPLTSHLQVTQQVISRACHI